MSRETTDILYIDLDYYGPENYYVYTAEAAVVMEGYIQDDYFLAGYFETDGSVGTLTVELTQVVGQTVYGSGTFNSTASMSVSVAVTRGSSATLNAQFTQTVSAARTRTIDSTQNSTATQTVEGSVTRGFGSGLNASANITCSNYRIRTSAFTVSGAFSASITCVATRTSEILLQSQFTQTASAARTRTAASTQNSNSGFSATAGTLLESTSTLNTSSTLSATALSVQFGAATLAATASLTADGFLSNRRPRQYTLVGSPSFVTGKYGQGLQVGNNAVNQQYLEWYPSTAWTTFRTMDFWVKPNGGFSSVGVQARIYSQDAGTEYFYVVLQKLSTGYNILIYKRLGGTNYFYTSSTYSWSDFRHVRILRHSGGIDLWIDGVLDSPLSDTSSETMPSLSTVAPTLGGGTTSTALIAIDEFWMTTDVLTTAGTASFTPPTTRTLLTQAQQNNTIVLAHMDGDAEDDLNIVEIASATLNSSATLSSDVARTRTTTSTLNSSAALSVEGIKIHSSAASTMTVTATLVAGVGEIQEFLLFIQGFATLSTTIGKLQSGAATLNSQSTLTVDALDLDLAQASLSSEFGITASIEKRFRPKGYVRWSTTYGIDINPNNGDPLEGSLFIPQSGSVAQSATVYSDDAVFGEYPTQLWNSSAWTIEMFHSGEVSTAWDNNEKALFGIDNKLLVTLKGYISGPLLSTLKVYIRDDNNNLYSWTASMNSDGAGSYTASTVPPTNHIALVKNGTNLSLFVNGYRKFSQTLSGNYSVMSSSNRINLGASTMGSTYDEFPGRYDDFKISNVARYTSSTYTKPSQQLIDNEYVYFNYDNNTLGLFHFNEFETVTASVEQSIGYNGIKEVSATLNSQFSAVGTISGPQRLPATTINSQSTLSVDPVVTLNGEATLNSTATLSVPETEIVIYVGAVLAVEAALSTTIGRIQPATATLNTSSTLDVVAGPIREFDSTLNSQFTQSVSGSRTRTTSSTMNSAVTMTVSGSRIRFADSTQPVIADISVDTRKTTDTGATLNSTATQTVTGTRIQQGAVSLAGVFTPTMTVNAILRPEVFLESTASLSTQPVKVAVTTVDLASEFALSTDSLKVVGFEADLAAQATFTADFEIIRQVGADLEAAFTQTVTTTNSKLGGLAAQLDSESTVTIDVNRTRPCAATMSVGSALVAGGARYIGVDSTMNSTTTLALVAGIIAEGQATLPGIFAELTAGDVINIDPYRTLIIEQETKTLTVLGENRVLIVDQETRLNIII